MQSFGLVAQQVLDDEERKRQISYIQNDTIPVEIEEVSNVINTQFSEYNGVLFPDSSFFFSSLRPESEDDYGDIFEQFWTTRIYRSNPNLWTSLYTYDIIDSSMIPKEIIDAKKEVPF